MRFNKYYENAKLAAEADSKGCGEEHFFTGGFVQKGGFDAGDAPRYELFPLHQGTFARRPFQAGKQGGVNPEFNK